MKNRSIRSITSEFSRRIRTASRIDQGLLIVFILIASIFIFATFKDGVSSAFETASDFIDDTLYPDTSPDPVSYPNAGSRYAGMWSYGAIRAIEGFNREVSFSLTGPGTPELSVNDGPYSATGTIVPGDKIRIRVMPVDAPWAERTTIVNIGDLQFEWQTKTYGFPIPDTNQIPDLIGVTPGANAYTRSVRLVDVPPGTPIAVTGHGKPAVRINNKDYVRSGTVSAGDIIFIRARSPQNAGTQTIIKYTIGTTAYQTTITTQN
ncbi:MAG: hypothetical protein AB8B62_05145 [Roseobacter sp.]